MNGAPDRSPNDDRLLDIVPADLLAPGAGQRLRRLAADAAAALLDGYLRRLAGQEARCRLVLGRLCQVFLRRRAHHDLGFARLGDFGRERLGFSAREVHCLAHVATRLQELPAVARAFSRGDLCWTRVRQLVTVATPDTEEGWLELLRGRTARILDVAARRAERARGHADDTIDGEPKVTIRLPCPRRVRTLWREAVELARRVWGAQVQMWQVAEAVAAEGLSARGLDPEDLESEPSPAVESGDAPVGREPAPIDARAEVEPIPEAIEQLAVGCASLDAFALDHRLRQAVRALQRIDWQTGALLHLLSERRLHRLLGFASLADYVRGRLTISPRKARALITLERRSAEVPTLAERYHRGELSWLRVLALLPVARGAVAAAWVERAGAVTLKRLVDEVDWALSLRDTGLPGIQVAPPPLGAPLVTPQWQIGARQLDGSEVLDAFIAFPAPASLATLLREATDAFAERGAPPWQGLERLLAHARETWSALPGHRDPVFARDGWRCAVPACSARQNLHDHHILFRSRGGDNRRDNRVTVCAAHHLHGIHRGRIRARGEAPEAIVWELGVRPGRPPLLRLEGERYL
jgi:hypothetical protein